MILAGLIAATTLSAADLPEFSFREHNTRGTYAADSLEAHGGCEVQQRVVIVCSGWETIAERRMLLVFTIANAKLSRLTVAGQRRDLPNLLTALTDRYGEPCSRSTEILTTGVGRQFESSVIQWCFRTGNLVLRERVGRLDQFQATYTDTANPVPPREITPGF